MQVINRKIVPIPVAREIVSKMAEKLGDPLIMRTLEYLNTFSKCEAEAAERAVKRLVEELKLSEITAVNLVNIAPKSIHEARVILELEPRTLSTEEVEKAVKIVMEECGLES